MVDSIMSITSISELVFTPFPALLGIVLAVMGGLASLSALVWGFGGLCVVSGTSREGLVDMLEEAPKFPKFGQPD